MTIRASSDGDRDWGDVALRNIETVATSAANCFPVFEDNSMAITLLNMTKGPMTVQDPRPPEGRAVVWVNVEARVWDDLAYQFAHEFCHVIADIRTWPGRNDRFAWIEEALCETASLFALRAMGKTWAVAPPYSNWMDYAAKLDAHASFRMSMPEHRLPSGAQFRGWLADRLGLLEAHAGRRDDNTIIAKELLPIFEGEPTGWRAIRHLHEWEREPTATRADFFAGWSIACPAESRSIVTAISARLS